MNIFIFLKLFYIEHLFKEPVDTPSKSPRLESVNISAPANDNVPDSPKAPQTPLRIPDSPSAPNTPLKTPNRTQPEIPRRTPLKPPSRARGTTVPPSGSRDPTDTLRQDTPIITPVPHNVPVDTGACVPCKINPKTLLPWPVSIKRCRMNESHSF